VRPLKLVARFSTHHTIKYVRCVCCLCCGHRCCYCCGIVVVAVVIVGIAVAVVVVSVAGMEFPFSPPETELYFPAAKRRRPLECQLLLAAAACCCLLLLAPTCCCLLPRMRPAFAHCLLHHLGHGTFHATPQATWIRQLKSKAKCE
jgi:hypothetical protein